MSHAFARLQSRLTLWREILSTEAISSAVRPPKYRISTTCALRESNWAKSFNAKVPSLTYYTYFYATSSSAEERQQAWAAALVLLAVVMILNVGIRLITGRRQVQASRAD